jgi:CRP/FNR family transcriptional regulator, nitrogen oxide reductase regulator
MDRNLTILNSIQKSDLFKGLTEEQYNDVIKNGFRKRLPPHSILFHQGDPAVSCFLVKRGLLKLTTLNEQGKEVIIRYIGVGELTAAVTVLKNGNYPVTAESTEDTDVNIWDKPVMIKLMHRFPEISINLLGIVLERIGDLQQRYIEVCTEHVDQRIARSLLRLMSRTGSKTRDGILIDIALSRQNIADYSGTTLYTVSRTLSAWQKKGWIKSGREKIIITDPHALVQFAETG